MSKSQRKKDGWTFSHYVVKKNGGYLECADEQFIGRSDGHAKWSEDDKKNAKWWAKHTKAKVFAIYYRTVSPSSRSVPKKIVVNDSIGGQTIFESYKINTKYKCKSDLCVNGPSQFWNGLPVHWWVCRNCRVESGEIS